MLDSMVKAHQAIGEYFCAFSSLERELGQAIKVVLRLQDNAAADAIVSLIGDFARKAGVVREAVQTATRAGRNRSRRKLEVERGPNHGRNLWL
jgi:hypothetical protein